MRSARVQPGHVSLTGLSPLAIGAAASVAIHAAAIAALTFGNWSGAFIPARPSETPAGDPVRVRLTRPDPGHAVPLIEMPQTIVALKPARPAPAKLERPPSPRPEVHLAPSAAATRAALASDPSPSPSPDAPAPHPAPDSAADLPDLAHADAAVRLPTAPDDPPDHQPTSAPLRQSPIGHERGVEIVKLTEPIYPERSVRNREQGDVVVRVEVRAGGAIGRATIHESSGHPRLDRAALKAAERSRFHPAQRAGKPITSEILVPFEFRIRG